MEREDQNDLDQSQAVNYLYKELEDARAYIEELEQHLAHEVSVNEKLTDKNIDLKSENTVLKQYGNVKIHPSSLLKLQKENEALATWVHKMKEALDFAISQIPRTRPLQGYVKSLQDLRNLAP